QRPSIGGVPEESAVPAHLHEVLVFKLFQVMRESRIRNADLALNFTDHKAVRMSGQEQPYNSEPGLRSHRRKHVGIFRDLLGASLVLDAGHISRVAEIWKQSTEI